jgi:hypothetical protein
MIQQEKQTIKQGEQDVERVNEVAPLYLKYVRFQTLDLQKSVLFYKTLGLVVEKTFSTSTYDAVFMTFPYKYSVSEVPQFSLLLECQLKKNTLMKETNVFPR